MSGPNDDVNTMRDLLQLLDSADGKDLAEFLESEHRELLHLRQKVAQYETAIVELSNNFARTLAQVQGKQPVPTTPQSSKYAADHSIHESVHDLQRITDLEQIVMEQKSDIADLEASLRERKVQIRSLRKQLRDKELRQFAVASECTSERDVTHIQHTCLKSNGKRIH
ncbi:hypothetical protein GGI07_004885 [Coemansia sp. Benny D115]|nr:hypothetical protein GGI07_004885 [Coemansia sp. Benny D115]